MAQLTPRGYTIPDGTDPISAGDDLLRANFTQLDAEITELAEGRTFGESVRDSDTAASVTTPISPTITLADAPAGLFLVVAVVTFASQDASYSPNYGQIVAGGQTFEEWRFDSAHQYRRSWTMSRMFAHAGGTVAVTANLRGNPFTLYAGCRTQVARVSP